MKLLFFIISLLFLFYFTENKIISIIISSKSELDISINSISYSDLFTGKIILANISISSESQPKGILNLFHFFEKNADINISNIEIIPKIKTLLSNKKEISLITIGSVSINSVNEKDGSNNILNLIKKISSSGNKNDSLNLIIDKLTIKEIILNTTYSNGNYSQSHIENITLHNIGSSSISDVIITAITDSIKNQLSFKDFSMSGIFNTLDTGVNLGTSAIDNASGTASSISNTINNISTTINEIQNFNK